MKLKSILVNATAHMSAHVANGGEKILGNMSSVKKMPDQTIYISGQKQRHAFFQALDAINAGANNTYVSTSEGISSDIANDLRADLGGYMHPQGDAYLGKRNSPVSATFAIADKPSSIFTDLLQRLSSEAEKMTIVQKEISASDNIVFSFHLDAEMVGVRKFEDFNESGFNTSSENLAFITKEEKLRRAKLFIEAATQLTAYSNSARNMVSAEPTQILIVLDPTHSRKASRYFNSSPEEREAMIKELESKKALYFLGDDSGKLSKTTVAQAIKSALEAVDASHIEHPTRLVTLEDFSKLTKEALTKKSAKVSKKKAAKAAAEAEASEE